MAVDLELIPYKGKKWPKKATFVRQGPEYHIRNWDAFFDLVSSMPKQDLPLNMALVSKGYPDVEMISTDSTYGERLRYVPASKVVSALKKALKKWIPVESQWAKEDAESYKKINKILGAMQRLRPSTPVILYWW